MPIRCFHRCQGRCAPPASTAPHRLLWPDPLVANRLGRLSTPGRAPAYSWTRDGHCPHHPGVVIGAGGIGPLPSQQATPSGIYRLRGLRAMDAHGDSPPAHGAQPRKRLRVKRCWPPWPGLERPLGTGWRWKNRDAHFFFARKAYSRCPKVRPFHRGLLHPRVKTTCWHY